MRVCTTRSAYIHVTGYWQHPACKPQKGGESACQITLVQNCPAFVTCLLPDQEDEPIDGRRVRGCDERISRFVHAFRILHVAVVNCGRFNDPGVRCCVFQMNERQLCASCWTLYLWATQWSDE